MFKSHSHLVAISLAIVFAFIFGFGKLIPVRAQERSDPTPTKPPTSETPRKNVATSARTSNFREQIVGGTPADPDEYPWQVALVGDTSSDGSSTAYQSFSLTTDTLWSGTTSHGYPVSFYVGSNGTTWNTFSLSAYFVATTCYNVSGTLETIVPGPGSITNNQFSISSSNISATGQFTSSTTATGTYSFHQNIIISLPFPPYVCTYYFNEAGTWSASIHLPPITISGNAGVADVTLSYMDGTYKTATSDNDGNYTIEVPYGWSGTIIPSRTGFTFTPISRSYSNLTTDQVGQNYVASWVGGVKIESNRNVVAVGRPHIGAEVMTYDGFSSGSTTAYMPMLFKDAFGGSYDSALYVENLDTSNTANVTIHFYDASGNETYSMPDTIAPLSSKGYWLPSITALGTSWVGGVKVESDRNIVAVGRPHVGAQVMTYNGFSSGSLNAYVPMLFKDAFGGSYDSALYVQNVDPSNIANITIHYYDSSGNETYSMTDTLWRNTQ